jgi:hypothetical protein
MRSTGEDGHATVSAGDSVINIVLPGSRWSNDFPNFSILSLGIMGRDQGGQLIKAENTEAVNQRGNRRSVETEWGR